MRFMNARLISVIISVVVLTGSFSCDFAGESPADLPTVPPTAEPPADNAVIEDISLAAYLAQGLEIPWAMDFLPDGSIVFTERPGRIRLVDAREGLLPEPLLTINEVVHQGEGGLLGIVVHPDFLNNRSIYVYYTYQGPDGLANRVVRFRKHERTLRAKQIIIDNIPAAPNHNGGRLKFGPDGLLYVTTGDASIPDSAQDLGSLAGKILRLKDDGTIPSYNPFPDSPVYSLGHRNPQGLAWDAQRRLWATEHGSSATDELNLIEPGKNYGWPIIRGSGKTTGLEAPVIHSGEETWAPSGLAFLDGSLFFTGLRGQSWYEVVIGDETIMLSCHLNGNFGRLRDVVVGPDSLLYLLTSNRDGRGAPTAGDDQIIRINPEKL